jgi:Na+/proline symporter
MPVCLTVTVLAVARLGGWSGFAAKLPPGHLDFGALFSHDFLAFWCVAMLLKQVISTNNLLDANRYLSVKDSRHARWAGFLGSGLYLLGIVIWFVPPMAARALFPDLHDQFPNLEHPEEAAYIATARAVAPIGMLGLLVSGIFAATMSAMDAGLNKSAGIFIKNFYQPVCKPDAPDKHLLKAGKVVTLILGIIIICVALRLSHLKHLGLFLLMQRVSILIGVPITVPLVLALIVRRTPPWSGWSTVLVGFAGSLLIDTYLPPAWAAQTFAHGRVLDASTQEYWRQGIQLLGNVALGVSWFLFTTLFWKRGSEAQRAGVEKFLVRLDTPIDFAAEEGAHNANDARQSAAVGWLCVAYGSFVILLSLIPGNTLAGRCAFLGCGGLVAGIGTLLIVTGRRGAARVAQEAARTA